VSQNQSGRRRWLMAAVKLLIVAAILWWVHGTIANGWAELTARDKGQWNWQPAWLLVAGGVYLLGLLPFGLFWFRVLRGLGQEARLGETLRAYYIGHLGKYVPGKAMVVVVRTGLIRGRRVDTAVAAVSVFLETLTMMAVGAFTAAAYLALFFREEPLWSYAAGVLVLVSLLPTLPPVFKRLVRLAGVGRSVPDTAERLAKLGYGTLLMGWLFSILGWVLLGLSYWATLRAMGVHGLDPIGHLPRYIAGVALAVVAGFLLLILPGGLGVREAFLAKLMLPYLDDLGQPLANSTAWASAFLLRLVWTASELIISGILYFLSPRRT
jgi:uncharacterized membrane protein YbhN (UPF0104 family)